jgi:hypothetical protein
MIPKKIKKKALHDYFSDASSYHYKIQQLSVALFGHGIVSFLSDTNYPEKLLKKLDEKGWRYEFLAKHRNSIKHEDKSSNLFTIIIFDDYLLHVSFSMDSTYSKPIYSVDLITSSERENSILTRELLSVLESLKAEKVKEEKKGNVYIMLNCPERGLYIKNFSIEKQHIDLDLYYEEGTSVFYNTIHKKLSKDKGKGIVFLHGAPGTGKTTFIRHLINNVNKKIIFVSSDMVYSLADPSLVKFMIENSNSIMVIEDAENIIESRSNIRNGVVSNLLNLSDGLLSDVINIQFVCTFNVDIVKIDKAFFRGGRLIGAWEFKPLSPEKANILSQHIGIGKTFSEPATISEILYADETLISENKRKMIGYKKV